MKDTSEAKCECPYLVQIRLNDISTERLKENKMQVPKIRFENDGFLNPNVHGLAAMDIGAIAVEANFGGKKANYIVHTVNGMNLKTRVVKLFKRILTTFKNFCARSQMNDNTIEILRSERSGKWCSHPEYIKEMLDREKMRIYDIR
jgi:hypothetical protein